MVGESIKLESGRVTSIDGYLDPQECETLNEDLRRTYWWASPIIRRDNQNQLVSGHSISRTSSTTDESWLSDDSRGVLRAIEQRLARALDVPVDHFEPWQLARYRAGERFDEHHDSGFFAGDRWGERTITALIYLSDSPQGGSTYFPALKQRFQPVSGRLLTWLNLLADGSADPRMRHIASPARRVKTIASTWVRELPTREIPIK